MHQVSLEAMKYALSTHVNVFEEKKVIDIGSYNFTGSYKELMRPHWKYTGVDLRMGPNVDFLWTPEFRKTQKDFYDIAISGQCLEHVEMPWLWIAEIREVAKPGGLIILVAPWRAPYHPAPLDCWRIFPDGAKALCRWGNLEVVEIKMYRRGFSGYEAALTSEMDNCHHGSLAWGDDTLIIARKP